MTPTIRRGANRRAAFAFAWFAAVASTGCGAPPERVVQDALDAVSSGHASAVLSLVADDYSDPLGGRDALVADLGDLGHAFGSISLSPQALSVLAGESRLEARVVGRLDANLVGETTWKVTGPLDIELRRDGGLKIRSGFLVDLRDVRRLMRARVAALEANDPEGYARLLHPAYHDGDVGREETISRLKRDLEGTRIRVAPSLYKLELRGPNAHIDESYALEVGERALPPAIARLTLTRAAGLWKISAGLYPPASPQH